MSHTQKKGFQTVPQMDMEDYKQQLREHRLKVFKRTVITIFLLAITFVGIGLYMELRQYDDYDVRSSVERADAPATIFAEFGGNILKYNNDGAIYIDDRNELIWNQTYEMSQPTLDTCEAYLTIYDKGGKQIYILTAGGVVGNIETNLPILQVSIANQGTVAVLMDNHATGQLALYDLDGNELANGAIHGEKGGYPIAIALSNDAIKLAVSMLDINDGNIKTTIAFYNFGSVGENEIDHIVAANSFSDMVIPELDFVTNDRLVAFGDTEIVVFEGTQKPKVTTEIPFSKEVKSIFHNENYIGVITHSDESIGQSMCIYDMKGRTVMEQEISSDYTKAEFLANNEICIYSEKACDIYTHRGIYKFHHEFDDEVNKIMSSSSGLNYTFILNGTTDKVRLK